MFRVTVDRDSSFPIDDVAAGKYVLTMPFDDKTPGRLSKSAFTVPAVEAEASPEPVDLLLEKR